MKYSDELEKKIAKEEGREPNVGYHGVFSTHPDHEKRLKALGEKNSDGKRKSDNKERFLKLLDGSLYGTSPEEGYVKNLTFYHPVLAIKFKINDKWKFKNEPDRLILEKENSILILRADELLQDDLDNELTPEKYLKNGIEKTSFLTTNKLIESEPFSYNGLIGHTYLYHTKSMMDSSYKRFTVIFDIFDKKIRPKAWIAVTTLKSLDNDEDTVSMLKSFSKMSKEEIANSKGLRIKVIRYRDGMSYKDLAKSSPLGKFAEDKLRLLNGHYPDSNPVIGDLIKIVQ